MPLVHYLAKDHGWTLVYFDEIASIFIPTDDAHREMRERALRTFVEVRAARQRMPDPVPPSAFARAVSVPVAEIWRQRSYANLLRSLDLPGEAVTAYRRSLALDPDQIDARFSLGFAYWDSDQRDAALREWREVLRRDPGNERVKQVLARATGS